MQDLTKDNGRDKLKPGDPWTFVGVTDEQLRVAHVLYEAGQPTAVWWSSGEPGRLFRTDCIHDAIHAIETVYVGFQKEPGSPEVVTP